MTDLEKERIKVVYSWIGPRGPIWNTELPHVLSFAQVAEGGQTTSRHWWADDLWNRLFRFRKHNYELYPSQSIEIDDKRPFVFPFSLAWRIPFERYFVGGTGILEFSHMPYHLRHLVRTGNGYILVDLSVEAFMSDNDIRSMSSYFRDSCSLPLNKIIYMTGCMNAAELYEEYCQKFRVPNDEYNRLQIISYPSSQQIFATNIENGTVTEPPYDENFVPEKLFLMWNRRFRTHRTQLTLALYKAGLIDRSYISFNLRDPEKQDAMFKDTFHHHTVNYLGISTEDINNFNSKLPLVIDGATQINAMCEDLNSETRQFYHNSLVSIVTETNWDLPEVTLTEKSFKPLKEKHPFIIVGVPGALRALKGMGFKTFNQFWPEDYDNIQDPNLRMQRLATICEIIGSWNQDQIRDFRRQVKPIVEHNFNMLKNPTSEIAVRKMTDIIRGNLKT
jgi:hypothetical protein